MENVLPNDQLRSLRMSRKISRQQLAEQIGISFYTIGRWERGETLPSLKWLEKLCAFFQMSSAELGFPSLADSRLSSMDSDEMSAEVVVHSLYDPAIPLSSVTGLVGREKALFQLKERLEDPAQSSLIAVHGLPGVGKTALVTAIAHDTDLREHFVDGILWAGLGPQPNLLGLLSRWGVQLGLTTAETQALTGIEPWCQALRTAIGARRFLIVIDDVWSVEDALACKVGGIHCRHLMTTRFPAIASHLTVDGVMSLQELDDDESLALLQRLASQAVIAESQKGLDLVRAAGGLPLALLLMGNYLRAYEYTGKAGRINTLLQSLEDVEVRLRLSEADLSPESHPSQRAGTPLSLQSVIAVTEQILSEQTRAAFYALSILPAKPNSFSEETALAVAACTTDNLDMLSDSGLLECSSTNRYMLHQVIADYAYMHLTEQDRIQASQRLITYTLSYIEPHKKAYELLEIETSSIIAALNLSYELQEQTGLIQGVCAFAPYLILRGFYALAEHHLRRAYETATALNDKKALVGGVLRYLGEVAQKQGNFDQAETYFQEGLRLARELGDDEHLCDLLTDLGSIFWRRSNNVQAEAYLQEGLLLARKIEHNERVYTILKTLGAVFSGQGDFKRAVESFQKGLELARLTDDRESMCLLLGNLGVALSLQGQQISAVACFQEGLMLARQIRHREQMCVILLNLGNIKRYQAEYDIAEIFFRDGLEVARQIGHREWTSALLSDLGSSLWHQGNYSDAENLLHESLLLARQIGRPEIMCNALNEYGNFCLIRDQIDAAEKSFQEMLNVIAEDERAWYAIARYGLARVAASQGDLGQGRTLGEFSLQILESIGYVHSQEIKTWLETLNL